MRFAHLYHARVFATVNTILFDEEIEEAVRMIWKLYQMGVDALIVQDLGLLECDLPPIELHASTQCHNMEVEKIQFLQNSGFARVILARECSLGQMQAIRAATQCQLEAFVHGALCVSYSGQCYLSQSLVGRSGNRGACAQPCRNRYDLLDGSGRVLLANKHLLSLKDFCAADSLADMARAGITSFKIEGRLKDLSYVKNVTAHYRRQLDALLAEGYCHASAGSVELDFAPDVERTFNRTYTDYFLHKRQPMANFATAKALGKRIGRVVACKGDWLRVHADEPLACGDGLVYFDSEGNLQGFMLNAVEGDRVRANRPLSVAAGTPLWRNMDQEFERKLSRPTARRRVQVEVALCDAEPSPYVMIRDEEGLEVRVPLDVENLAEAVDRQRSRQVAEVQLGKLGGTPFAPIAVRDLTDGRYHLPASLLNAARRRAVDELIEHRISAFRPADAPHTDLHTHFPAAEVDYRANVVNRKAEEFYNHHGTRVLEHGLEQTHRYADKPLMTTKYCLRYELGCCRMGKGRGVVAKQLDIAPNTELLLRNNGRTLQLRFDCARCEMQVWLQ